MPYEERTAHHDGGGWGMFCVSNNAKKHTIPSWDFYKAIVFGSRWNRLAEFLVPAGIDLAAKLLR